MTPFIHDPQAVLDYVVDWSTYLGADTISTSSWTADSGITVESDEFDDTSTTIWLSGGTRNHRYGLTNHILTAGGRDDEWTIYVLVKQL